MTTIAMQRPIPPYRPSSPLPASPILSLDIINSSAACPMPIPNKHIPICPPGPAPNGDPDTPPASPPTKHDELPCRSLLFPPTSYDLATSTPHPIYSLHASQVAAAIDHLAAQPLPQSSQVFPWMHGLHSQNVVQQAFFTARRRSSRRPPRCLRGIMVVKADGDLSCSQLKGAVAPCEILDGSIENVFKEVDPKEGFSVRNFQIQVGKMATLSDIIVYGEDEAVTMKVAKSIAAAQRTWRSSHETTGTNVLQYNTFICTSPFQDFQSNHPDIVYSKSCGSTTKKVMDFFWQERFEMSTMSAASEIAPNVWLGPTPDASIDPTMLENEWDVLIECGDMSRLDAKSFEALAYDANREKFYTDFPSSGSIMPPSWSLIETEEFITCIMWIHALATGQPPIDKDALDADGDTQMTERMVQTIVPRRVLIHCTDGYTESSLLALAYYIYSTGCTVPQAYLELHTTKGRNFFSYPSDVALLNAIVPRLLASSPALTPDLRQSRAIKAMLKAQPAWAKQLDGSLPSRITDSMYLGNLNHANNPALLKELGIGQLLSVGELASWTTDEANAWGEENVLRVQGVQDNGVDELWGEIERCLAFVETGRKKNIATLVHCRVGVSRSATICIASIMATHKLSYPRAYCYVRARRLNVIIQPHLRFSWELLRWEEELGRRGGMRRVDSGFVGGEDDEEGVNTVVNSTEHHLSKARRDARRDSGIGEGEDRIDVGSNVEADKEKAEQEVVATVIKPWRREMEWNMISREIANMNRPYAR